MLKIELKLGQKAWITSDTHFGHKNICRGTSEWDLSRISNSTTRDFQTLDEMNQCLIDNINKVVGQDDVLLHLGDWSFGGFDNIRLFRDRIVCQNIHLITGNHDHHIVRNRDNIRSIFSSVNEDYTQFELTYPAFHANGELDKVEVILCHYPITSWNKMNDGVVHLFGHVHLPPDRKIMPGRSMDVGVDGNNYKPYKLFDCINMLSSRPIGTAVIPIDHHVTNVSK